MPAKYENLSIPELKSKLVRAAEETREAMGELLYWLRKKSKAQGKRNDLHRKKQGFRAWCEANLGISRRTADRWADEWAFANGKKKRANAGTSRHRDQKLHSDSETTAPKITFNLPLLLTQGEHDRFMWAVEIVGEDEVTRLVFKTVTETAKSIEGPRPADPFQLPPKLPAASAAGPSDKRLTFLDDLEAKQPV